MAAKARDAYLKVLQNKDALFEYQVTFIFNKMRIP